MVIQGIILFAIVLLILFVLFSNLIMYEAGKQNKAKKGSAIRYMIMSIFSGIVIVSFSIWIFLLADL
ncbi:hypothetical protein ABEX69_11810 [Bacillus safensis]|uniref:hypothetical protein n=1 Tax=Bacillus safensis TaxID=561879 RepID=UPI0022377198|nr:hypothetical protein [Bacillus safensis]MCW4644831.1 hypothetical protein [Bacillus safensis]MCY7564976.1 hypothetical protein [Bacillus safensis]MCY7624528.1 hypothetical protein [Bacillus safensis]MCY7632155.1 hypothetical protein [Bacillus safensis]MCY7647024.1 hypothetical protein [Bacillus safensis]